MTTDKELRCASCHAVMNLDRVGRYKTLVAYCQNQNCDDFCDVSNYGKAIARWENELERIGQKRNEDNAR